MAKDKRTIDMKINVGDFSEKLMKHQRDVFDQMVAGGIGGEYDKALKGDFINEGLKFDFSKDMKGTDPVEMREHKWFDFPVEMLKSSRWAHDAFSRIVRHRHNLSDPRNNTITVDVTDDPITADKLHDLMNHIREDGYRGDGFMGGRGIGKLREQQERYDRMMGKGQFKYMGEDINLTNYEKMRDMVRDSNAAGNRLTAKQLHEIEMRDRELRMRGELPIGDIIDPNEEDEEDENNRRAMRAKLCPTAGHRFREGRCTWCLIEDTDPVLNGDD